MRRSRTSSKASSTPTDLAHSSVAAPWAVLRSAQYRRFFVAQVISGFGDSALYLSLGIWIKDLTGSTGAAGLVFLFLAVPTLVSPMWAQVVDRFARRQVLIVTYLGLAALVMALLLVRSAAATWLIYTVALGYGVGFTIIRPAQAAMVRRLASGHDLAAANALIRTATEALRILSPLAGAALYAVVSPYGLVLADVTTFVLATVILFSVPRDPRPPRPAAGPALAQITAGLRFLWTNKSLRRLACCVGAAFGVIGLFDNLDFAIVTDGLGRSASFFGVLMSVQGAGSILGGLTVSWLVHRHGEHLTAALGLTALAVGALLQTAGSYEVVLSGALAFGIGVPWLVIAFATGWQRQAPEETAGRIGAAADTLTVGPQSVSIAVGAGLVEIVDYRVLLCVAAAVMVACGIALATGASATRPVRSEARIRHRQKRSTIDGATIGSQSSN